MSRKYRVKVGDRYQSGTTSQAPDGACSNDDFGTPAIFANKAAATNAIAATTKAQQDMDRCTMYRDLPQFAALRFDGIPTAEPFEEQAATS